MALEGGKTFARKHFEEKKEATPTQKPENIEGPTMAELLNNQEFAAMLESENDPALVESFARIKTKTETSKDVEAFIKQRKNYLDRVKTCEGTNTLVDRYFETFCSASPELAELNQSVGPDVFKEILKQGMRELAFNDFNQFAQLHNKMVDVQNTEKTLDDPKDPINKTISDFITKHSLNEERVFSALGKSTETARTTEIQKMLREQMGFLQKFLDKRRERVGKPSSRDEAQTLSQHKDELNRAANELDTHIEESGALMYTLMTHNPLLRTALMRTVRGEQPAFVDGAEAQTRFNDIKNDQLDTQRIARSWETFLHHRNVNNFEHLSPDAQDSLRDRFWKRYVNDHIGERQGFWSNVLRFLISQLHKTDNEVIRPILS